MSNQEAQAIAADAITDIAANSTVDTANLSLEALILLINAERLKYLQDRTNSEFKELKKRQEHVSDLYKLLKKINANTSDAGEFDCSENQELQDMLKKAQGVGVDMKEGQHKLGKDDKDRLVSNIRMTIDDLSVKNDMQLQTVNRLTNERYEAYQMARSILKPLHDAKMKVAQGLK